MPVQPGDLRGIVVRANPTRAGTWRLWLADDPRNDRACYVRRATLEEVRMHTDREAQQRVAAGGQRTVHAWLEGVLVDIRHPMLDSSDIVVRYDPTKHHLFHASGGPVSYASYVYLCDDGLPRIPRVSGTSWGYSP